MYIKNPKKGKADSIDARLKEYGLITDQKIQDRLNTDQKIQDRLNKVKNKDVAK